MNTFDRFCTPGWDKVKVLNVNRRFDCEGIEYVDCGIGTFKSTFVEVGKARDKTLRLSNMPWTA